MRCKDCKDMPGVSMIGQCSRPGCTNHTPSASNTYCESCSNKLKRCEGCGKKMR